MTVTLILFIVLFRGPGPIVTVILILFIVLYFGPYCDRQFDPVYCALSWCPIVTVILILFFVLYRGTYCDCHFDPVFFIILIIFMNIKMYVLFIIPNRASQLWLEKTWGGKKRR